jgi:hypothetical protein
MYRSGPEPAAVCTDRVPESTIAHGFDTYLETEPAALISSVSGSSQ